MKLQAPIEVEIKVNITDGEKIGVATLTAGIGKYPTETDMRRIVKEFESNDMPDGFRLMTKREWWNTVCPPVTHENEEGEPCITRVAIPGGNEWDT